MSWQADRSQPRPQTHQRLRWVLENRVDPLHVGRRYRTATPKMRRALAERDRRCVWPGCDRPPEWSQGDHELPWAKGGETEVESMRLLCRLCRRRHKTHWGYPFNRTRIRAWGRRSRACTTRGPRASFRPGSAPTVTAWTTWSGCAGRVASCASAAVTPVAGGWAMAGSGALDAVRVPR